MRLLHNSDQKVRPPAGHIRMILGNQVATIRHNNTKDKTNQSDLAAFSALLFRFLKSSGVGSKWHGCHVSAGGTWMCFQRGPTEDDFKKCRRHPKGEMAARRLFAYFLVSLKSKAACRACQNVSPKRNATHVSRLQGLPKRKPRREYHTRKPPAGQNTPVPCCMIYNIKTKQTIQPAKPGINPK